MPTDREYRTPSGLVVQRQVEPVDPAAEIESIIDDLDSYPGVVLASTFEYPGRYTRWSRGFARPPLALHSRDRQLTVEALNERGEVLLDAVADVLAGVAAVRIEDRTERELRCEILPSTGRFSEEERSKQNSVFSPLRALIEQFALPEEPYLGFYGAFGYDLVFQFENITRQVPRDAEQRELVLYLPDSLVVVDHASDTAFRCRYEFRYGERGTAGRSAQMAPDPYRPAATVAQERDQPPGGFAEVVSKAKESFRRGDLFEVVPSQTFFSPGLKAPSRVFRRLRTVNPAPFGALLNLRRQEYLISASPEMYVRVEGKRVESCPISGTIRRGEDVFGDAQMIRELLNSSKDEAELTMCTDVDRNDKSRICEPGSVAVIGRRQIEMYSKVIHTVDHIEGTLRSGYDAIDAFLTHMWAVTVTGAPKLWAMRFIEQHERTPRGWYGGAIGVLGFDGNLNTGLTLRTVSVRDGVAQLRAGGTLLIDSEPEEEERESEASGTDSRGTFNRGHGRFFEAGRHSLILVYAWHHTANTEDTFLDLLASEGLTDWTLTNHPGRAWLYDDSDFRVDVLQVRRDGSEVGDIRGFNVIVDATLRHTVEDHLTGLFNVRGEQTNGAVGMLGIEGEERSCRYYPNGVYPFNASLHIPPSPSGDYEFRIEAKVERHVYPHSVLLVADVDVPVQPWPPGVFADDTVNEVVMGTFCDGD
jgi:anthranilate synthase